MKLNYIPVLNVLLITDSQRGLLIFDKSFCILNSTILKED